jgi:polo-like kinase 1
VSASNQVLPNVPMTAHKDRDQLPLIAPAHPHTVWVTKWVDYSTKYGLGYLLSDQSAGVFFNDSTKIVVEQKGNCFYYYERKAISQTEKQDVLQKYSFTDYPKELQKKVTLLEHFKSYLQSSTAQQSASLKIAEEENNENMDAINKPSPGSVYVKKWMRTKHAIMFRLSNKIV